MTKQAHFSSKEIKRNIMRELSDKNFNESFDAEMVENLLKNRRSIKPAMFSDKVINKELVNKVLSVANWAPTHGLNEPWRFKVYTGESLGLLSEFMPRLYKEVIPVDKQKPGKVAKQAANPLLASHVIAIGMHREEANKIPEMEDIEAVACAVQNMMLMARALGIGSFWSTGDQSYSSMASDFFGWSSPSKYLGLLYLGYPKEEHWGQAQRQSMDAKVTWM